MQLLQNETCLFLGPDYNWSKATLLLDDVQGLTGGVRVWLPTWGPAYVTRVARGGQETKFKVPISTEERKQLVQLCVEQDFVTIQPEARLGLPDEPRPSITLTNSKREEHTVSKWAVVTDARFDAVYQPLMAVAARTEGRKPLPKRFTTNQKVLFWLGIAGLALLPFGLGYLLAGTAVSLWWPDHLSSLVTLLLLLIIGLPLLLVGLRWLERYKASYERLFTNSWLLIMISWVYLAILLTLPGFLQRISLVVWADTAVGTIQSLDYRTFFDHTGPTDSYKVFYTFQTADGRDYHREAAVDRNTFETLAVGDEVSVNYLPFFPRYALLDYQLSSEMADYALLLLTAVVACYLFIAEAGIFGATIYRIQDERF